MVPSGSVDGDPSSAIGEPSVPVGGPAMTAVGATLGGSVTVTTTVSEAHAPTASHTVRVAS